jgi:NADH:ubiquinone oxidoreductase subunit H
MRKQIRLQINFMTLMRNWMLFLFFMRIQIRMRIQVTNMMRIQLRKGPNKVRVGGILQPFNDAIKLFSKEIDGLTMPLR